MMLMQNQSKSCAGPSIDANYDLLVIKSVSYNS